MQTQGHTCKTLKVSVSLNHMPQRLARREKEICQSKGLQGSLREEGTRRAQLPDSWFPAPTPKVTRAAGTRPGTRQGLSPGDACRQIRETDEQPITTQGMNLVAPTCSLVPNKMLWGHRGKRRKMY